MRKFMTFAVPAIILIVALAVTMIMVTRKEDPKRRPSKNRSIVVKVAVAEPKTLRGEIRAFGTLESAREYDLVAELGGILEEGDVPFLPGQSFEMGQVLIRVDERPVQYRIAQLKSAFLGSLARLLPELELDFPHAAEPWREYFAEFKIEGPLEDLPPTEDEKIKLYLARHNIYQGFYDIRAQELLLSKAVLRAPFDGVIADTQSRTGASVMTGGRLGRILSMDDLELAVDLPAAEAAWLDAEAMVEISSPGGSWTGRILRIGSLIDQSTQTLPVFIGIEGGDLPPAGSFLEARFRTRRLKDSIRVPRTALHGDRGIYSLKDGRLQLHEMTVARLEEDSAILSSGFSAGDSIVVEALEGVVPGMAARARAFKQGGAR